MKVIDIFCIEVNFGNKMNDLICFSISAQLDQATSSFMLFSVNDSFLHCQMQLQFKSLLLIMKAYTSFLSN